MSRRIKPKRRRGRTRLSAKKQVTIPVAPLRRVEEALARYAGRLTGVYSKATLRALRREWR